VEIHLEMHPIHSTLSRFLPFAIQLLPLPKGSLETFSLAMLTTLPNGPLYPYSHKAFPFIIFLCLIFPLTLGRIPFVISFCFHHFPCLFVLFHSHKAFPFIIFLCLIFPGLDTRKDPLCNFFLFPLVFRVSKFSVKTYLVISFSLKSSR
jgi:hypothetical protein